MDGLQQRDAERRERQSPATPQEAADGFGLLAKQEHVGRILDHGLADRGSIEIAHRLGDGDGGTVVFAKTSIAMLDELADIAVGQEIPGLIDEHQLEAGSVAEIHGLLDLIDQLQQHDLLEMASIAQMLELEHSEVIA